MITEAPELKKNDPSNFILIAELLLLLLLLLVFITTVCPPPLAFTDRPTLNPLLWLVAGHGAKVATEHRAEWLWNVSR